MPKNPENIEPINAEFDSVVNAVVKSSHNSGHMQSKVHTKENGVIEVQGVEIHVVERGNEDYISLTDMTKAFPDGETLIRSWFRTKTTIEFLGVWERINNTNFNLIEFDQVKSEAGSNTFTMSGKRWAEKVNGIGILSRSGRTGGGTFAHKDIAFEFGSWLSPEFKLYLIKEFQRLKEQEASPGLLEWNIRRTLAKAQYRTHTDAVKNYLIPAQVSKAQEGYIYASEADLLSTAIFGMTAKEWKSVNPGIDGTQRDAATIEQLIVLTSLESQNALLIQQGKPPTERLKILNDLARMQMQSLLTNPTVKKLADKPLLVDTSRKRLG